MAQQDGFSLFNLRKRSREEDEDELCEVRQDNKKPRALPFRASPTTKHTLTFSTSPRRNPNLLLTPVHTPTETSDDEAEQPSNPFSILSRSSAKPSAQLAHDTVFQLNTPDTPDSDVDMDSQPPSPRPWGNDGPTFLSSSQPSPATLSPGATLRPHDNLGGGRIPTPIYGHFQSLDVSMDNSDAPEDLSPAESVRSQQELAHSMFVRRRLPSPIREDEVLESPASASGGHEIFEPRASSLFRKRQTWPSTLGESGAKAGKTKLSMGFKADCEKCQARIPGHYMHFIRS